MKEIDQILLSRITDSVKEAFSLLLDYLQREGIADWLERYAPIKEQLELGNYEQVVQKVGENSSISRKEAIAMDLICLCLDEVPPKEKARLERGRIKNGKYINAYDYSTQLLRATDVLRVYISYRIFNEPIKIHRFHQ